jgi:predicted nucleic acid-binding protein
VSIVVDASALLCLAFDDEGVPYGTALIDAIREEGGLAPPILWYELRNALVVNERRRRIEPERSASFLTLLGELPIVLQPQPLDVGVLDLARRFRLAVYDATYLELAVREGAPLATLDSTLREAARAVKTRYWEPSEAASAEDAGTR